MPVPAPIGEHQVKILRKRVFAHATFDGAISETGYQLTGVDPNIVREARATVISGDVHKPQTMANGHIEYVGAPYHIHFGDNYDPRVMLIKYETMDSRGNLYYPAPRKFTQIIKSLAELYRVKIKPATRSRSCRCAALIFLIGKNIRDAIKEHAEKEGQLFDRTKCVDTVG
jgi:hypothetical protein